MRIDLAEQKKSVWKDYLHKIARIHAKEPVFMEILIAEHKSDISMQ